MSSQFQIPQPWHPSQSIKTKDIFVIQQKRRSENTYKIEIKVGKQNRIPKTNKKTENKNF